MVSFRCGAQSKGGGGHSTTNDTSLQPVRGALGGTAGRNVD